jgi:hypothetical protein
MKKFGTPIGAGPGSANENVGFAGVGTPPAEVAGAGFGAGFFAGLPPDGFDGPLEPFFDPDPPVEVE